MSSFLYFLYFFILGIVCVDFWNPFGGILFFYWFLCGGRGNYEHSKRGVQKRVVSVPIGDVDGSKSKGETYPPSDSWAWRKYGQKPIKGSPFPR